MQGTAVLYKEDHKTIILRNIEKTVVEQIKSQCGCDHCFCQIDEKQVDFGHVAHVIWMDRADIGD